MDPVCKCNVAYSAPAAVAVLLVMIWPPFVTMFHHCLSADGGICGRGSKPGHDAGINGPYHPPCHGHGTMDDMDISSNKTLTGFSSIHSLPILCVWLESLGMLHFSPCSSSIYGKLVSIVSGAPPDFRGNAPGIRGRFCVILRFKL